MSVRGNRKTQVGVVVSDKMDKTIVVKVSHIIKHPDFNKYVKQSVKYKAHDENNVCRTGDRVQIVETRPLSRDKRWKLKQVLERIS
jgi:small subunit ribosomal protein S17